VWRVRYNDAHMVTQELLTYIREQQKAGFTLEQLRPALQEAGWKEGLIGEAFDSIMGKVASPALGTVLATKPEAIASPIMGDPTHLSPMASSPSNKPNHSVVSPMSTMQVKKPHADHVLESASHDEVADIAGAIAQTASAIGAAATGLGATALAGTASGVNTTSNTLQAGLDSTVSGLEMNTHSVVKKGPLMDVHTPANARTMNSVQQPTTSSMSGTATMTMERPRVASSYQQPVASAASPAYPKSAVSSSMQSSVMSPRSKLITRREVGRNTSKVRSDDSAGSGVRAFWFVLETLILIAILAGLIFGIYQVYSSGATYETLEESL